MAQPVNPFRLAIDNWLDRVECGVHGAAFRDAWLRLNLLSTADLEFCPQDLGPHHQWLLLSLQIKSFGQPVGSFACAVRDSTTAENQSIVLAAPSFSPQLSDDLRQATLVCLYRLAPPQTCLEVLLVDDLTSPVSTLATAGQYTDAGWGLDPKRTELISDDPRRWIFRFSKN